MITPILFDARNWANLKPLPIALNLRDAYTSQNQGNKKADLDRPFKVVFTTPSKKRHIAPIVYRSEPHYHGTCDQPELAARAYDKAAVGHVGDFAFPSFRLEHQHV